MTCGRSGCSAMFQDVHGLTGVQRVRPCVPRRQRAVQCPHSTWYIRYERARDQQGRLEGLPPDVVRGRRALLGHPRQTFLVRFSPDLPVTLRIRSDSGICISRYCTHNLARHAWNSTKDRCIGRGQASIQTDGMCSSLLAGYSSYHPEALSLQNALGARHIVASGTLNRLADRQRESLECRLGPV